MAENTPETLMEDFRAVADPARSSAARIEAYSRLLSKKIKLGDPGPLGAVTLPEFLLAVARRELSPGRRWDWIGDKLDPMELVDEVLVILFEKAQGLQTIATDQDLTAWVWGAIRTIARRRRAQEAKYVNVSPEFWSFPTSSRIEAVEKVAEPDDAGNDQVRLITTAIEQLPRKLRDVAKLRLLWGLPLVDIAETLKISPETARQRWFRARRNLKLHITRARDNKP